MDNIKIKGILPQGIIADSRKRRDIDEQDWISFILSIEIVIETTMVNSLVNTGAATDELAEDHLISELTQELQEAFQNETITVSVVDK